MPMADPWGADWITLNSIAFWIVWTFKHLVPDRLSTVVFIVRVYSLKKNSKFHKRSHFNLISPHFLKIVTHCWWAESWSPSVDVVVLSCMSENPLCGSYIISCEVPVRLTFANSQRSDRSRSWNSQFHVGREHRMCTFSTDRVVETVAIFRLLEYDYLELILTVWRGL